MQVKIIIDQDYEKYRPLVILSEIDTFEVNTRKYKQLYVFIDDLRLFKKKYKQFGNNCIFIINKNIYIDNNNIDIKFKKYDLKDINFKNKIINHTFIRNFLNV